MEARTSSKNVTLRFWYHFSIIQSHYPWKCVLTILELNSVLIGTSAWHIGDKIDHLSSYARVVHTTAKQVISRRKKNENVFKMSKDEKCTFKAFKNTVFHYQICKFAGGFVAVVVVVVVALPIRGDNDNVSQQQWILISLPLLENHSCQASERTRRIFYTTWPTHIPHQKVLLWSEVFAEAAVVTS